MGRHVRVLPQLGDVRLRRKLLAAFGLVLLLVAARDVIAYSAARQEEQTAETVQHTLSVIQSVDETQTMLLNMESSYWGFLLTGEESFLAPYQAGSVTYPGKLTKLKQLSADDPSQIARWEQIGQLVIDWQNEAARPGITLRRDVKAGNATLDDVAAHVIDSRSQRRFDTIQSIFATAINSERSELAARTADADAAEEFQQRVLIWGGLTTVILGLTLAILIGRSLGSSMQRLATAADEIASGRLDRRVGINQRDEIGRAATAFDAMAGQLQTTLTRLEEAVLEADAARVAAEDANRLKSEFLSRMSHELRTPMNGIIGYAHLLLDGLDGQLTDEQESDIRQIATSADHLLALINDILDLAKVEAGHVELAHDDVDISTIVARVVETVRPQAQAKGVEISIETAGVSPAAEGDETRIRQILLNLVGNAVKFTDQGRVTVATSRANDCVAVAVTDTGIGISPEAIDIIFDEFRQADGSTTRRFGGTGLGLAIARKLARLHGGDITVASEPGVRSTFTLTLPLADSEPALAPEPVSAAPAIEVFAPSANQAPLVLIVEDDPPFANLIQRTVEAAGGRVIYTANGAEALELAEREPPSLVLLDVLLGEGLSGWEVLRGLRSAPRTRQVPVVVVSCLTEHGMAATLGATDYLVKPVEPSTLIGVMRRSGAWPAGEILVVDDDPTSRELLRRLLTTGGYNVRFAADGDEALTEIARHRPDLVVLDLMMPRVDGMRVLDELRASPATHNLPVIVVTAKDLGPAEMSELQDQTAAVMRKAALRAEDVLTEVRTALARAGFAGALAVR